MRALTVAIALTVAPVAQAFAAGHPESVDAPELHVGDTWVFDSIDGYKNVREFTIETRVAEIGPDRVTLAWRRTDDRAAGTTVATRSLNWIERRSPAGVNVADPFYPDLAFPLAVGKTWTQRVTFHARYEQERTIVAELKGTVVGWEQVTVPAGTFDALRIDLSGDYRGESGNFNWKGYMQHKLWYVPEVHRVVRSQYEDSANSHGYVRDYQDLVSYKLQ